MSDDAVHTNTESNPGADRVVIAFLPRPAGGLSVTTDLPQLSVDTLSKFAPMPESLDNVRSAYTAAGLQIESESEVGLSMSGPVKLVSDLFRWQFRNERMKFIRSADYTTWTELSKPRIPFCQGQIESVLFPKQLFVLERLIETGRPTLDYEHLTVPEGVRAVSRAGFVAPDNASAPGVPVAMIDTGCYPHRHFASHGYDVRVVPALSTYDPALDERGHGTGMASILLSIAPDIRLTVVKAADLHWSCPLVAMQRAASLGASILNCSWGTIGFEPALYLEVANLAKKGTAVVFAAGNGSTDRSTAIFQSVAPPFALSVGGCWVGGDGTVEVSGLSSSYDSAVFPGRSAPDLCGICGNLPYGQVVLMPTQPGSLFDTENGRRDGTRQDDGWFVSSGTSAAAAYVSGLLALLVQARPDVCPTKLARRLGRECRRVTHGKSAMGHAATANGRCQATGWGFLDGEAIQRLVETAASDLSAR